MACYAPLHERIMLRRKEKKPTVKFGQRRNGSRQQAHYFVTRLTPHAGSVFFFFLPQRASENLLRLSGIRTFGISINLLDYLLLHCSITFPPFLFASFSQFPLSFSFLTDSPFGQYSSLFPSLYLSSFSFIAFLLSV